MVGSFCRSARPKVGGPKQLFPRQMESVSVLNSVGVLKKLYRCKLCGHIANRSNNLKTHLETHTRVLPCLCKKCGSKFQWRAGSTDWLSRADITHINGKKTFQCRECGHTTSRSYNLKKHLQSHAVGGAVVSCPRCGETCAPATPRTPRGYHVKEVETVEEVSADGTRRRVFRCRLCRAVFPRRGTLHAHLAKHKSVGFLVCHACGGEFLGERSLREHERSKHPPQPQPQPALPCPYCGEQCPSQDALYTHSKIHMTDLDQK